MSARAIIITDEQVERLERWLNHLDKMSMKYWNKSEEAEKAGDMEAAKKYERKSFNMDAKQDAALKALDGIGIMWKCSLNEDGTDSYKLILP